MNLDKMIITIGGHPGSGKDALASLLSEDTGMPVVSMGNLRREAADKKGMTLQEFNTWSKMNPEEGDAYFDNFQVEYGKSKDNFIMVSRLGFHWIPHSETLFLSVDPRVGAERIYEAKLASSERNELGVSSVEEQVEQNRVRMKEDEERFFGLYRVNIHDLKNFKYVQDTSEMTQEEVVAEIKKRLPF